MDHPTTKIMEEQETKILDDAIQAVYGRTDIYGKPEDTFQTIAELWNGFLRGTGIPDPNIDCEDVANMMILLKVARSAEGHYHKDNWIDIAGYAENAARLNDD